MKTKVGFYYHIMTYENIYYSCHQNRLILTINDNYLQFKLINPKLLPKNFDGSYYTYNYPIIYEEDNNGNVTKITFLYDIPIIDKPETSIEGYSIFSPKHSIQNITLFYNGKDILGESNSIEIKFYKHILLFYVTMCKVSFLRKEEQPKVLFSNCLEYINTIKSPIDTYVNTINISEIISDLQIEVYDHLRRKIGDDDTYVIWRKASVSNPIANKDIYLQELIGLGEKMIYKDSGFTHNLKYYANDFIEKNPLGNYKGELLEKEKEKIIQSYSKEKHINYLLAQALNERETNRCNLPKWERALRKFETILLDDFRLSKIFNTPKFEHKIYPFQNRDTNANNELEKLNIDIKNETIINHLELITSLMDMNSYLKKAFY